MKVTNNHDAALVIAGVEVRPGATVEVDQKKFDGWKGGNAASIWLDMGLVTTGKEEGKVKAEKVPAPGTPQPTGGAGGSTEKGDATPAQVREAKLQQARDGGKNPNNNISNAKLDEMLAEIEAEKAGQNA